MSLFYMTTIVCPCLSQLHSMGWHSALCATSATSVWQTTVWYYVLSGRSNL